ncbi:RNA-processing protein [Candidatus Woesearchaeota archaeon]|nr:RNA-processing protein [Candidatus Woesearchaeota archaeon]
MLQEGLKIPKKRIAVLIGEKGKTKKKIERATSTRIIVNSEEGDVIIESEESLNIFNAKPIIQSIGRGFNPSIALRLAEEENMLEIIDITNFSKKSKRDLIRLKARLIGTNGKARKMIEMLTHTEISVYGKTVSIIGEQENTYLAKRAIQNLLQGSKHGNVYGFIERNKSKLDKHL